MHKLLVSLLAFAISISLSAQGGITPEMLQQIKKGYQGTPEEIALRNAISHNDINKLAVNLESDANIDTYFSDEVKSKGISNQQSSGRCWLFSGLNVMRARMIDKYDMGSFQFSQNYCFFYDQLEKSNLFLQAVIDNAKEPMENRTVEWLFKNPLSDGGQFTGIMDIVSKYGLVPSDVMPETYCSNNTSDYAKVLSLKLREYGL